MSLINKIVVGSIVLIIYYLVLNNEDVFNDSLKASALAGQRGIQALQGR